MRIARYQYQDRISYGVVEEDRVRELDGSPFEGIRTTSNVLPLAAVKLLAPVVPSKVIAVANNYHSHLDDEPVPNNPEPFYKVPTAIIGPEDNIIIPPGGTKVESEAEMVIVIGKRASRIRREEARSYIFGATCGNDVSERVWQRGDIQWWRGKSADTFAPLGPWIATDLDYDNLLLTSRVNGEVKQQEPTSQLIFNTSIIVSFISQAVTLLPGDVIYTGTVGRAPGLKVGDTVEVEVEHIGVLQNRVVSA